MSLTDSNRRKPYNDFEFYLAAEVYAVAFSYLENSSQHFNNLVRVFKDNSKNITALRSK